MVSWWVHSGGSRDLTENSKFPWLDENHVRKTDISPNQKPIRLPDTMLGSFVDSDSSLYFLRNHFLHGLTPEMSESSNESSFAWISRGRLFVQKGHEPVQEIESDFARSSLEREMKHQSNNAWKDRSSVWGDMGMAPPGVAPWAGAEQQRRMRFVTMAKGDSSDEIYYVLDMGPVGGLFKYDMELEEETRLMHSQNFLAQDISRHPVDKRIAVSLRAENGMMGLSITRADGLFGKRITLSDTIDEAPSWLPDGSEQLVFSSSAIGRDDDGSAIGKSCCRIEMLDLQNEEINKLFEVEEHDLLQPRLTDDKKLLCIRRPYKASHREPATLLETAKDIVLFPFRLIRAFVYFFNFLSMAFTGKPLMSAGGPESQQQKNAQPLLMLYGQAVDTQKAMSKGAGKDPDRPLVPKEWELVERLENGDESVLANNVLSFDADSKGNILYTDGRRIYLKEHGQQPKEVAKADIVEKVVLLS